MKKLMVAITTFLAAATSLAQIVIPERVITEFTLCATDGTVSTLSGFTSTWETSSGCSRSTDACHGGDIEAFVLWALPCVQPERFMTVAYRTTPPTSQFWDLIATDPIDNHTHFLCNGELPRRWLSSETAPVVLDLEGPDCLGYILDPPHGNDNAIFRVSVFSERNGIIGHMDLRGIRGDCMPQQLRPN